MKFAFILLLPSSNSNGSRIAIAPSGSNAITDRGVPPRAEKMINTLLHMTAAASGPQDPNAARFVLINDGHPPKVSAELRLSIRTGLA